MVYSRYYNSIINISINGANIVRVYIENIISPSLLFSLVMILFFGHLCTGLEAQVIGPIHIPVTKESPTYWDFILDNKDKLDNGIVKINKGKKYLSAFFIGEDILVTARHGVSELGEKFDITRYGHKSIDKAVVYEISFEYDIALLKVESLSFTPYVFQLATYKLNETVYGYGYGKHKINQYFSPYRPVGSRGHISGLTPAGTLSTTLSSSEGHSGSPVLNAYGSVVGMFIATIGTTRVDIDSEDGYVLTNYRVREAEPVLRIKELLKRIK